MAKLTYFIKKKIGKEIHSFSVEGDNFHELIMASKNLSFYGVDSCGKCGSDDLALGAHIAGPKKHKYVTIKCLCHYGNVRTLKDFKKLIKPGDEYNLGNIYHYIVECKI